MEWFFGRLNTSDEPVFGYKDKSKHKKDFAHLIKLGLLKEVDISREIECDLCDEGHQATPFQTDDGFAIVCGSSSRKVSDDELKVWTVNQDTLLALVKNDIGIGGATVDETQGDKKLWKLGKIAKEHGEIHCYYLRQDSPLEFERLRNDAHDVRNVHNVIFTNTEIASESGVRNMQFFPLPSLVDGGKSFFSAKKLEDALLKMRRVQFDARSGNLYLDGDILHAFGTGNERKYFIEKLWKDFEQSVSNDELYKFIREKMGTTVADTPQKYCNKVKSAISKEYPDISKILTQPQRNEYMLKDLDR